MGAAVAPNLSVVAVRGRQRALILKEPRRLDTMSDDEYDPAADLDPAEAPAPEDADPDERELLGDAAGSDDETGDEEGEGEGVGDADEEGAAPPRGHAAHPQRPRVDPLLRESNRPRAVRIVPENERQTSDFLQKTEAAQIIAMRAQQIATRATQFSSGASPGASSEGGAGAPLHDPVAIAFQELFERRCPLLLRREVGIENGVRLVEEWDPNVMAHTPLTPPVPLGPARPKPTPVARRAW